MDLNPAILKILFILLLVEDHRLCSLLGHHSSSWFVFFGVNLTALTRKCGGIRPIAVGCTLRRLVAKVAANKVRDEMSFLLAPRQLGFGVKGGAEAAVMQQECMYRIWEPAVAY